MIMRENYLSKIRPFIGKDIIKVLTGIRRSGKVFCWNKFVGKLIAQILSF